MLLLLLLLLLLLVLLPCGINSQAGLHSGEYCDTEMFRAECQQGEVILMERARYGRMHMGRCVEISLGYVGCYSDVLAPADARCSGKRVCEIRIPDAEFEATEPCLKELKTYLDASYRCVPVHTVSSEYCRTHDQLDVTQSSGFLSSAVTSETPHCDGSSHPWAIIGKPGQHIELTLYDFGGPFSGHGLLAADDSPPKKQTTGTPVVCLSYGLIEDSAREKPIPICRSTNRRVNAIYRSMGNVVKVWITTGGVEAASTRDHFKRFLIRFSVVGCGDPEGLPEGYWFNRTRDGNGVVMCHNGMIRTRMECLKNNTWKKVEESGSYINCSTSKPMANRSRPTPPGIPSLSLVVSLVVLVGSVVGATVLILMNSFVRCRKIAVITSAARRKRQNEADFRRDLLNDDVSACPQQMTSHTCIITEPLIDAAPHHPQQGTTENA